VATWKSAIENLPLVVVARTCAALLRRLVGRDPDLLNAWIEAEKDASLTLARWRNANHRARGDAHAAYVAALDREAHAAEMLRRRVQIGRSGLSATIQATAVPRVRSLAPLALSMRDE
jgi:hypothetical protein